MEIFLSGAKKSPYPWPVAKKPLIQGISWKDSAHGKLKKLLDKKKIV
jgi:hypothetical protein